MLEELPSHRRPRSSISPAAGEEEEGGREEELWGRRGQVSLEEDAPIGDTHQVTITTHHKTFHHPFVHIKSSPPRV